MSFVQNPKPHKKEGGFDIKDSSKSDLFSGSYVSFKQLKILAAYEVARIFSYKRKLKTFLHRIR